VISLKTRLVPVAVTAVLLVAGSLAAAAQLHFTPLACQTTYCQDIDVYVVVLPIDDCARLEFYNDSPIASSVGGLYFEKGPLDTVVALELGDGTFFEEGGNPARLPGGRSITPPFETAYVVRALPPTFQNGIGPAEQLTLIFDLAPNTTFDDLITQLHSGELRIGIHVIGLPDGSSLSAINNTPEPAAVMILGMGCLLLIGMRRNRSNRAKDVQTRL